MLRTLSRRDDNDQQKESRRAATCDDLGCSLQEEEAAEVAALADEADMPLEQLLAAYGYIPERVPPVAAAAAGPDSTAAAEASSDGSAALPEPRQTRAAAAAAESAVKKTTATENEKAAEAEPDEQHGSLEDAARAAVAAQPTGFTLATTSVQTKVPASCLSKHPEAVAYQELAILFRFGCCC